MISGVLQIFAEFYSPLKLDAKLHSLITKAIKSNANSIRANKRLIGKVWDDGKV